MGDAAGEKGGTNLLGIEALGKFEIGAGESAAGENGEPADVKEREAGQPAVARLERRDRGRCGGGSAEIVACQQGGFGRPRRAAGGYRQGGTGRRRVRQRLTRFAGNHRVNVDALIIPHNQDVSRLPQQVGADRRRQAGVDREARRPQRGGGVGENRDRFGRARQRRDGATRPRAVSPKGARHRTGASGTLQPLRKYRRSGLRSFVTSKNTGGICPSARIYAAP
jgi:hypothetical protein